MNAKRIFHTVLFTPGQNGNWGLPLKVEGPPGSAKTSNVGQVCQSVRLPLEVVIASIREPADFLGLPIPRGERIYYAPPAWASRLVDTQGGVVFFDEINTAPAAVLAALLVVILDRRVGDLALPPRTRCLAAQNPTEDAVGGSDLPAPLANRFLHWSWDSPDVEAWSDYILSGAIEGQEPSTFDPLAEEARVLLAWPEPFARSRGLVSGFLRRRPELLLRQPKAGDPAASKAWPSPRTWEMTCRALAGAEVHGLTASESELLLSGCVGTGAAAEFLTYVQETDLPDPAALLDGKQKFTPDERLDRTMAVFSACAALVTSPNAEKRNARAGVLWGMLGAQATEAADVIVPAARALVRAKLSTLPEAKSPLLRLQPLLQATGVL